ncbi:MAG TPA: tetratricopeptide repeat protein [Candidatus Binataceae bacterium]|nr:tetratricopeptide repeat protein [Candidatus Binataceae bacterium]
MASQGRESAKNRIAIFLEELGRGDLRIGGLLAAVLAITTVVLFPSLGYDFVSDDNNWIVHNRFLGDWSFVWRSLVNNAIWFLDPNHPPQVAYYRPLQNVWFALNYHLFGLNPIGWHAAMIALHLIVVLLVFRVASGLTADNLTGLFAAALFALMPYRAEAVVWIAAVGTPLSAAFQLGSFEAYLNARDLRSESSRYASLLSMALFAGALLSYDGAVAFPFLIAAHALIFGRGDPPRSESNVSSKATDGIAAALPYALELGAYLALRYWVLGYIARANPLNIRALTGMEAILTIPAALASYVTLIAMPWRAGPTHELARVQSVSSPDFYLPILVLAALCWAGWLLLRRTSHRRLYLFCGAWCLIALAPMLNLSGFVIHSLVQDRYLYLSSFGLCVITADLAVGYVRGSRRNAALVAIAFSATLAGYAAMLIYVERFWRNDVVLSSRCIEVAPKAGIWRYELGLALEAQGNLTATRAELERAIAIDPDIGWYIFYHLGLVDEHLGDRRAAEQSISAGLKKFAGAPPSAYANLALVADAAGDSIGAEDALAQAAAMPDGDSIAAVTRAQIRFGHRDLKGAEDTLRDLLQRQPNNHDALTTLGAVLSTGGRYEEALAVYRRAAQIEPGAELSNYFIAFELHRLGRDQEARRACENALAAAPNNPMVRELMAEIDRGGTAH